MTSLTAFALLTAFGGGIISFLSPCVLPLVPGYMSYVAGSTLTHYQQTSGRTHRLQILGLSLCFVAGFSSVFIALGAGASALGELLLRYKYEANLVGGSIVIVFGLFMIGLLRLPWLQHDLHFQGHIKGARPLGAYLIGLAQRKLGFDDVYYITDDTAVPFDPAFAWKDGDTIPRRLLLRARGDGSHADIKVAGNGRWKDGFWEVTLTRAMDTGNPMDDKIFADKRVYNLAFGVHRNSSGSRWHNISLPITLGLGREADLAASRFEGTEPVWNQPWKEVTLFYPGQVSWPMLNSAKHAGAKNIKQGVPVKYRHSESQLANYGVEAEFADEIRLQWLLTILAGIGLIAAFGIALNQLLKRKQGV